MRKSIICSLLILLTGCISVFSSCGGNHYQEKPFDGMKGRVQKVTVWHLMPELWYAGNKGTDVMYVNVSIYDVYGYEVCSALMDSAERIQSETESLFENGVCKRSTTKAGGRTLAQMNLVSEKRGTLEYSMENSFPEVSMEESVKIYRDWHRERFLDMIKLFPGITEMLQEVKARGYKTAIASSRLRFTLNQGLEKYGLEQYFDTVVAVEDAENGKPAPDIVLNTMERLDSKPETSIMVGDSRLDILCAHNAGVPCVLVGWSATLAGKTKEDFAPGEAPDYIIQKPADLLDII